MKLHIINGAACFIEEKKLKYLILSLNKQTKIIERFKITVNRGVHFWNTSIIWIYHNWAALSQSPKDMWNNEKDDKYTAQSISQCLVRQTLKWCALFKKNHTDFESEALAFTSSGSVNYSIFQLHEGKIWNSLKLRQFTSATY
jgi:hypothetical protein